MPGIIQKWDVNLQELSRNVRHKVNCFIKHNCIHKVNNNTFRCDPIPNYNSNTYTILIFKNNYFTCTCQHSNWDKKTPCSHIQAVKLYLNMQLDKPQGRLFNAIA